MLCFEESNQFFGTLGLGSEMWGENDWMFKMGPFKVPYIYKFTKLSLLMAL